MLCFMTKDNGKICINQLVLKDCTRTMDGASIYVATNVMSTVSDENIAIAIDLFVPIPRAVFSNSN